MDNRFGYDLFEHSLKLLQLGLYDLSVFHLYNRLFNISRLKEKAWVSGLEN
jgi:hypothetical protein